MESANQGFWKKCSICKKDISFGAKYYLCSVSTCKHPRKGYRFCSVGCWDAHLGYVNHRESWAEEAKAPSQFEFAKELEQENLTRAPVKKIVEPPKFANAPVNVGKPSVSPASIKTDTLVVVSKVKDLIRNQSEFNTSQCCIDALTRKVVDECLKAIEKARADNRKTVMGRDVLSAGEF